PGRYATPVPAARTDPAHPPAPKTPPRRSHRRWRVRPESRSMSRTRGSADSHVQRPACPGVTVCAFPFSQAQSHPLRRHHSTSKLITHSPIQKTAAEPERRQHRKRYEIIVHLVIATGTSRTYARRLRSRISIEHILRPQCEAPAGPRIAHLHFSHPGGLDHQVIGRNGPR